jgi:hypothetical protein
MGLAVICTLTFGSGISRLGKAFLEVKQGTATWYVRKTDILVFSSLFSLIFELVSSSRIDHFRWNKYYASLRIRSCDAKATMPEKV